ncbi:MAG: signal recognition particle-docking protein FtsY [Clostridia bacterium]
MSFFSKIKEKITKTSQAVTQKVDAVFASFHEIDDDMLDELEEALIMSDLGPVVASNCRNELEKRAKLQRIETSEDLKALLCEILSEMMCADESIELETTPTIVMVIGVNGVGKTTTIGKLATRYVNEGKKVMLCAADTFRAAAAEQLTIWAERANCDIVKHGEGADPAAVVYDAIASAKAKKADVIIIDTAGRLHNKQNLMQELEKMSRIIATNLVDCKKETLLALDATTGQNAVNQAREFQKVTNLTGIILTKLDGTAKGGIIIPISAELGIPVKLVGIGEAKEDLIDFYKDDFVKAIFE